MTRWSSLNEYNLSSQEQISYNISESPNIGTIMKVAKERINFVAGEDNIGGSPFLSIKFKSAVIPIRHTKKLK